MPVTCSVTAVEIPPRASIIGLYPVTHLADAYAVTLPAGASTHPEQLARFIFSQQPRWVDGLMAIRDAVVGLFGLKTANQLTKADGQRVGIFKVYSSLAQEVVLGEDDSHLDFRLSLLCAPEGAGGEQRLVLSTVVHCHNLLGRSYILLIAPFHRLIVRSSLRRAARIGWPPSAQ
ncbi:MAG: DUF2867 domain-containing protein [Burkholderiaceae bacterium]|nr:DUF2867 domain-containing protein [Burkholderiaceae bacterium]